MWHSTLLAPDEHHINMECNDDVADSILDWLKIKLPDYKNKVEALAEDVSNLDYMVFQRQNKYTPPQK